MDISDLQDQYESEKNPEAKMDIRKQIHDELQSKSEFTMDLDNLTPIKHLWIDRGLVMSCEGAGHPNHRHFKIRK